MINTTFRWWGLCLCDANVPREGFYVVGWFDVGWIGSCILTSYSLFEVFKLKESFLSRSKNYDSARKKTWKIDGRTT